MKTSKGLHKNSLLQFTLILILALTSLALASEEQQGGIDEVIVTAQRVEESLQDVPVAVTAFTGSMMEDKQIITPSDLQMNAPNVSFTATNFGNSSFSIRGIGRLVISVSGESGVSIHENEIPVATNLNVSEFYDVDRVEVLRGPQGTLFGRNATGGTVNIITTKPHTQGIDGFIDLEMGDYSHVRVKGAVNVPITDNFAIRLAGMQLKRDGYIENTAYGQVGDCLVPGGGGARQPCVIKGIDDDIDGRELYSVRLSALWEINTDSSLWIQYTQNDEDDDRVRITNQVCKQNTLPLQGCEPNGFGFDSPHAGTTTGGIFGGLNGAVLLGDPNPYSAFQRPVTNDFRKMHTDFEPVFDNKEETWSFGFHYDFEEYTLSLQGATQHTEYLSRQDYLMDVSFDLNPTLMNPAGYWPTSEPAGVAGDDWINPDCNYNDGTSGIFGGCILYMADTTRVFAYDQSDSDLDVWNFEARVRSNYEGPFNFLLGFSIGESEAYTDYYVVANSLDLVGTYGVPLLNFPPLYPTMYNSTGNPDGAHMTDTVAYFGEVYYQINDDWKFTFGLRYNDDEKEVSDSGVLFDAMNINALLGGMFGPDPVWLRTTLSNSVFYPLGFAPPPTAEEIALAQYYGVWDDYLAALGASNWPGAVMTLVNGVPAVPGFGEQRDLTGSPRKADWQETTGRIGVDWQVNENSMMYFFFSKGYKPGGFNPPLNRSFVDSGTAAYTFDSEEVNAIEIGSKNYLMNGTVQLNGAFFMYDYKGLQITRIANNTSINDNIDANIMGLEAELLWQPTAIPELSVDASYSWLNAEVDGSMSVDPINRTGGQADWITLENIDPGSLTGVNYVARVSQITPALIAAAYGTAGTPATVQPCGALSAVSPRNGVECPAVAAGTNYPGGVPAYFSRAWLKGAGVETSDGIPISLDGNELPNSPEHTIKIGIAYTFTTAYGTFTPRWDYYWQTDSYAREFNTIGDEIDSWDQHNLTLIYESNNGEWLARLWVRNVQDEDNVTGKYLTADTSGFFRNYFLTEPRIYGLTVRWQPVP